MAEPRFFSTPKAFRTWLEANATTATELLVGFHKVDSGKPSMTWSESVDEALCFGWIDGVTRRVDDASYTVRFTPRKPTSIWSKVNIAKYQKLEAEGRMTPAGAKAFSLRTEAKSGVYSFEQPGMPELSASELRASKRNQPARTFFEAQPAGYRKAVLHWVTTAKRDETRALRLAKLIAASAAGVRLR